MEQFLYDFVKNATNIQKGVFVMVTGILIVFMVQVIFYLIVKLWPKGKGKNSNTPVN